MPVLDNAKFLLMTLVILTHSETYLWPSFQVFIGLINPWHIKSYAFLAGLVARKPPSSTAFTNIVVRLVLPNVIYSFVVYPFLRYLIHWNVPAGIAELGSIWRNGFFKGQAWTNWFLWGLIWWQIVSYLLRPFKPISRMLLAIVFAAVGGYLPDSLFSFNIVVSSLPIYVAGQLFPLREVLAAIPYGRRSILLGGAVMFTLLLLETAGWCFMEDIPKYAWSSGQRAEWWRYQAEPCTQIGMWLLWIRGAVFRNVLELTKTLIFVFCLCPRSSSFMSDLGQYSLYPMLLHVPIMKLQLIWLRGSDADESIPYPENAFLVVLCYLGQLSFCFALTVLLSSKAVRSVFWVFFQPTWVEVFMDRDEEAVASQRPPKRKEEEKEDEAAQEEQLPCRGDADENGGAEQPRCGSADATEKMPAAAHTGCLGARSCGAWCV